MEGVMLYFWIQQFENEEHEDRVETKKRDKLKKLVPSKYFIVTFYKCIKSFFFNNSSSVSGKSGSSTQQSTGQTAAH